MSKRSAAAFGPMARGSKKVVPLSGDTPMAVNARVKLAEAAAQTTSAVRASPTPAPAAGPLTAATTGLGMR